ncbi:DUF3592 domain-containing protein [Streptomyces sp. NPDC000410]|uniref:DUF3592 domain-containing protein n=1 Tax=Streptomyces sp. NPDC000410 TaxID=3154254 RepID=UPI00332930D5
MDVPGGEYLFFGGMITLFGWLTGKYARRLFIVLRSVRHGERAEGECVRIETERGENNDAHRHFFVFRTREGREVEFEDLAGWSMRTGTRVMVAYDPASPERTATIAGRGSWSPVLQCVVLVAGCGMATAGLAAVFLFTVT